MVSYSHGSNDGQKGIGLMMLVLIGIIPAQFALSDRFTDADIRNRIETAVSTYDEIERKQGAIDSPAMAIVIQKLKPEFDRLRKIHPWTDSLFAGKCSSPIANSIAG
jgi:phosphate/sulfate permease